MKSSSRKIFKKIGAGLMLGLSLFNLGAAWNKADGWSMVKRSKKLRVKEKDQVDTEMVMFAEIAEEGAERAIKERALSQQEQIVEKVEVNLFQKIYRISAVGVLSMALGVFATSMIFNAPFALGKGLLSLLPGSPHLAVLSLSSDKKVFNPEDSFTVIANLDSNKEEVDGLKLVVGYNPNLVSFDRQIFPAEWEIKEEQLSENKRELVFLSNEREFDSRVFSKEDFIEINFSSKKAAAGKDVAFYVNQSRSLVVSKDEEISRNILGDTKGLNVSFSNNVIKIMRCQKIKQTEGAVDFWKDFVQGDLLNTRDAYWQRVDDSVGILCAHEGDYVYMTVVSPRDKVIEKFEIINNSAKEDLDEPVYSWEEGDFTFYLYRLSSNRIMDSDIEINVKNELFSRKQWPINGVGRIILE